MKKVWYWKIKNLFSHIEKCKNRNMWISFFVKLFAPNSMQLSWHLLFAISEKWNVMLLLYNFNKIRCVYEEHPLAGWDIQNRKPNSRSRCTTPFDDIKFLCIFHPIWFSRLFVWMFDCARRSRGLAINTCYKFFEKGVCLRKFPLWKIVGPTWKEGEIILEVDKF